MSSSAVLVPSLLFAAPEGSGPFAKPKRLVERLTFGFARGTEETDLLALVEPDFGESASLREALGRDLFLDELLERAFGIVARGARYDGNRPFLRRLMTAPPTRLEDALHRQRVFRELVERETSSVAVEELYVALRALRSALCAGERLGGRFGALRRRLEILTTFRGAIDTLRNAFPESGPGLRRLSQWAEAFAESPEFGRLVEVLRFEDERTVLEGRLQIGFDGTLRRFDIVGTREVERAPFARGPLSRLLRSLWGLLRGYRFSEEDVLSSLLDQLFSSIESEMACLLRLSLELEFFLAGLGFRRFALAAGSRVVLPIFGEERREIRALDNPWLIGPGKSVVSCDLPASPPGRTVIVTGPNSGGKTRFLQSIAITQLLAQQGLWVTAEHAELVWSTDFFLSLIERPASDQEEGRLGMELLRIRRVFESAGPSALVVMDELCSGTNPSEGEQIFEMVLELFREVKPQVFLSTHFLDFAARLAERGTVELSFLQVELGEKDVPTYRFVPGVAKTSMARATAARLGVTREELLALATRRAGRARE